MEHPGITEVTPTSQTLSSPANSRLNLWGELTCLALIFMEVCWIAPLYYVLARFSTGIDLQRAFIILGGILLGAYLQARLTAHLGFNSFERTGIFAIFLLLSLLVGLRTLAYFQDGISLWETIFRFISVIDHIDIWIPKEFGVCLVVLLLGLNGFSIATGLPDPSRVFHRFWASILMLLIFGLLSMDNPDAMPSVLLFVFLITSLMAMSAARLSLLGRLRGGQRIPFDLQRALGIGFIGGGMASLSLLAAFLLRSQTIFAFIYGIYLLFVRALALLFAIILLPIYLVLFYVLPGIKLPASIAPLMQLLVNLIHQIQLWISRLPFINLSGLFNFLLSIKPVVLWGLVILGLAAILIIVRAWTRRKTAIEINELQESDFTGEMITNLRSGLRKRISRLVERLIQRLNLRPVGRVRAAARIRRIYAELINQSARLGSPRPASFTPLEFLPLLTKQFPGSPNDLELITQAYIRIRYGELPEFRQQLDDVEAAWLRLQDEFRKKSKRVN